MHKKDGETSLRKESIESVLQSRNMRDTFRAQD